jgi:penicillin-binding protein 1C
LIAEESLRRQVTTPGVHGGSIVIIEVKTGAVRALVGSPDFWNQRWRGQVNGATARRSPGSALKPFVYATAIDQGLCTPATMIADVPLAIAGFHPQNFDHEFSGPVTVREALVRSLNIPALRMAQQVGQFNLVTLLRQTGLRTLDKSASHYGLGVALGSGEVTLLDLANAYACFARGGEYRPYRLAMMPDGGGLGTARPTPSYLSAMSACGTPLRHR